MQIVTEGSAVHIFSGTDAVPGAYLGTVGKHQNSDEGAWGSVQVAALMAAQQRVIRRRNTLAEVNAGVSLLAAVAGIKYRMIDVHAIAIGGAAATLTTADVLGTQATASVKLAAFAQASLTQSTVLRPGVAGTTVLADGASFMVCDENTAITVGKTGGNLATATHIDTQFQYATEVA